METTTYRRFIRSKNLFHDPGNYFVCDGDRKSFSVLHISTGLKKENCMF